MKTRALEQAVADAWRAVRWADRQGEPACHTCFDGADLERRPADPRNPALHRYRCTICKRMVSDWTETWIAPLKAPLTRWAYLVEIEAALPPMADMTMAQQIGIPHQTVRMMRARLKAAPPGFLDAWRTAMQERGVKLDALLKAVKRNP